MIGVYRRGDERPAWQATITTNGSGENYSSGFTFRVTLALVSTPTTVALTKTSNITGTSGGVVSVNWAPNELDLAPGLYEAQLRITRSSDSTEQTITDQLLILARN